MEGSLFEETQKNHTELDDDIGGSSGSFNKLNNKIEKAVEQSIDQSKEDIKDRIWDFLKEQHSPLGGRMFVNLKPGKPVEEYNNLSDLTPWMISKIISYIEDGELSLTK